MVCRCQSGVVLEYSIRRNSKDIRHLGLIRRQARAGKRSSPQNLVEATLGAGLDIRNALYTFIVYHDVYQVL